MAKDLGISYLLDFYGDVLTEKQRDVMEQYYNDDLSLAEIAANFGITRQGVRDSIKRGEAILLELEQKVGFAGKYREVQKSVERIEQLSNDIRFYASGEYMRSADVIKAAEDIISELKAFRE